MEKTCTHFIGFKDSDRFRQAISSFGKPDFIHRQWDGRAKSMIVPGDVAIFAQGSESDEPCIYSFDDSRVM
jgi:hypothetical protein